MVDWFDFWLHDQPAPPAPGSERAARFTRWQALRALQHANAEADADIPDAD